MKQIIIYTVILITVFYTCANKKNQLVENDGNISMTLIPPSPVSDQIILDIRAGLKNKTSKTQNLQVSFYVDKVSLKKKIHQTNITISPDSVAEVKFNWSTKGQAGNRTIIAEVRNQHHVSIIKRDIRILASETRSTNRIDGAFLGFYHWSEDEGKYWNNELKRASDSQWREMMDAQKSLGMNIIIIQDVFRNSRAYAHKHTMETTGYTGIPYYPSNLFQGKVDIVAKDPVEAVLAQADLNNMHVFVGIGMYAWFDFSSASLEWHKMVADEIWKKYGHHPSFYGWYISEEQDGGLGTIEDRENIVVFFREFKKHIRKHTPDKPVMLATNSLNLKGAEHVYRQLLQHLDILCPFAFHRMPATDLTGEAAAELLQQLCDEAGSHLWLDLESFDFAENNALVPRSIDGILNDMHRFKNFEKIICYQFPGLFSSPDMSFKPGGERTVKLYRDYKTYYGTIEK